MQTDASAYGVGAVLSQEGEIAPKTPHLFPIAYYSATFMAMERNYDIYERELLAVIKALQHWRQYLIWTQEPFIIQTDHANLLYWKSPRKLNQRTAQWHAELQDYNFQIVHIPGKSHVLADMLSRPPGVDQGGEDNTDVTMIPERSFIRIFMEDDMHLERQIEQLQNKHATILDNWSTMEELLKQTLDPRPSFIWRHPETFKMVIPPDDELCRQIMKEWHDNPVAGHPG